MKMLLWLPSLLLLALLVGPSVSFTHHSLPITIASPRTSLVAASKSDLSMSSFSTSSSSSSDQQQHRQHHSDGHHHHLRPFLKYVEQKEQRLLIKLHQVQGRVQSHRASMKALQDEKRLLLQKKKNTDVVPTFTETTTRSMVKSLLWRVIAGSVTFATTLRFSGSVHAAWQVVGADFFSKALTMFIGERLMNKSQAGRQAGAGGDHVSRSLAKAIIWRLFAVCNTLTMAIFVAKDLSMASKIASTDAVFKTGLMFVYERIWARVQWGKEYYLIPATTTPVENTTPPKELASPLSGAVSKLKSRMPTFQVPRLVPQSTIMPAYASSNNVTAFDAGYGL